MFREYYVLRRGKLEKARPGKVITRAFVSRQGKPNEPARHQRRVKSQGPDPEIARAFVRTEKYVRTCT